MRRPALGFRNVPDKQRLLILIPADLDQAIRDEAHRTRRSISDVASTLIARGLGRQPGWAAKGPARQVASAS
jgi:hypothetical protein